MVKPRNNGRWRWAALREISDHIVFGLIVPPIAAILVGVLWHRMAWPFPRAAIVGTFIGLAGAALDWPNLRRNPLRLMPLAGIVGLVVSLFIAFAPNL